MSQSFFEHARCTGCSNFALVLQGRTPSKGQPAGLSGRLSSLFSFDCRLWDMFKVDQKQNKTIPFSMQRNESTSGSTSGNIFSSVRGKVEGFNPDAGTPPGILFFFRPAQLLGVAQACQPHFSFVYSFLRKTGPPGSKFLAENIFPSGSVA